MSRICAAVGRRENLVFSKLFVSLSGGALRFRVGRGRMVSAGNDSKDSGKISQGWRVYGHTAPRAICCASSGSARVPEIVFVPADMGAGKGTRHRIDDQKRTSVERRTALVSTTGAKVYKVDKGSTKL